VFIDQGDWTCSIAKFTGTMKGPMQGPNGEVIPPTNKSFEVEFCTVAHWVNGENLKMFKVTGIPHEGAFK
jgi:hypothetical protein